MAVGDNFIPGKSCSVLIGAATYAFGKFKLGRKVGLYDITNYTTAGFADRLATIFTGEIEVEAPSYDVGNMPITLGGTYNFTFNFGVVVVTMYAIVDDIEFASDVQNGVPTTFTAKSKKIFGITVDGGA